MNPKPESSKYLILKKNTPIKLSELLGGTDIPINSEGPKKYLITVRPHSNSLNKSGYRSNSLVLPGRSNVRKYVLKLPDLLKRKSLLESSFIFGNRTLEKIDEQSESSSTSMESSQGCDLKVAEPLTDIHRLRGGCGCGCGLRRRRKCSRERRKCSKERRKKMKDKSNQTDLEDSDPGFCKKPKKKWKCRTRLRSRCCRRYRTLTPSDTSLKIYEADLITSHTKDEVCQTAAEKAKFEYPSMLGLTALDSETCGKVDTLERQLRTMTDELKDLREELLAPEDLQKFKYLSDQFREVSELLTELKSNCVKCLRGTAPLVLEIQETCGLCKKKQSRPCCNCPRNIGTNLNALPSSRYSNTSDMENSECNVNRLCSPSKRNKPFYFARVPNECDDDSIHATREHFHNRPDILNPSTASSSTVSKSCVYVKLPVINSKLDQVISRLIGTSKHQNITLTVVLESNQLFHINVSILRSGKSLGCIYATEPAINEAQRKHFFDDFLTFFVLNSKNTIEERNKMLNHSFESKHSSK